ncbi:hypothetical protein BDA96_03G033500 [Sorghum bicolor]|uniref:Uncharacterized protein n=1 Tax=Sorghum bicolor TaxID=4558 RepID=A0A921RBQ3_SORBI|nr:hypothetical protein BDA96_03G033500 [Sorghum bicolor]
MRPPKRAGSHACSALCLCSQKLVSLALGIVGGKLQRSAGPGRQHCHVFALGLLL